MVRLTEQGQYAEQMYLACRANAIPNRWLIHSSPSSLSALNAYALAMAAASSIEPHRVPYPTSPADAPNMVVIVLDDIGFGQLGCFGSLINTPHIDSLAERGIRLNRFHVTSICSSTRAALFTGRNHHAVGVGATQETSFALPGYSGEIHSVLGHTPYTPH